MTNPNEKVIVENVNHPGKTTRVDAAKYQVMKKAYLKVLPNGAPGLTQSEATQAVKAHLPEDLFPGGKTSGWWSKTVQLDLEAKGQVVREDSKPLRWHKISGKRR